MNAEIYRRPRFIVATAVLLYVVALVFAWTQGTTKAERRAQLMLEAAETGYDATINGEIEAALRNVGGAIINVLGGKCQPLPIERMQELARTFNLDEINIVNREGLTIGSNVKSAIGFDFNSSPVTREFMALTNSTATMVSQPFRRGVANPDMFCKYYGMPFPAHDGLLQLGVTVQRLRQNMYTYTQEESECILKDWHFSVVGWYERADHDNDFVAGRIFRRRNAKTGEREIGRYFDYKGYRYIALLPANYCYSQRNSSFLSTALVLAALVVFFTFILVRLTLTTKKLEALHTAAAARTAADLALARTIQMSALPATEGAFLDHLEFSLYAESCPAREVGGDFYDFYPVSGGRIVFLVADVSGKGIPGAMFMMEVKNILKNCLIAFADIAEAVKAANDRICEDNRAELFVTAWIGALDPKTGTLEYVNAGHNRPFVRHADGTVEKVCGKGGRFLGMFPGVTYQAHTLTLNKDEVLYLYTDGVTEAMNGQREQFGERRLCEVLATGRKLVKSDVNAFVGDVEQSDDLTDMAIWWHGKPSQVAREFPCDESSLSAVVAFIRAELTGFDRKTVAAMLNAADEIVSNIVNYSGSANYEVEIEKAPDRLRLRFIDSGRAYNPLSHVDPDTHAAIEDRPIGGLGLVVVKRLVDRVTYARENARNVLTLMKRTDANGSECGGTRTAAGEE